MSAESSQSMQPDQTPTLPQRQERSAAEQKINIHQDDIVWVGQGLFATVSATAILFLHGITEPISSLFDQENRGAGLLFISFLAYTAICGANVVRNQKRIESINRHVQEDIANEQNNPSRR